MPGDDVKIGKHLATFNLFREADNSIHVTIAEARGVAEELGGSGAPLYLCAMTALRAAEEIRASPPSPPRPDVEAMVEEYSRTQFAGGLGASRPAIEQFARWVDARRAALSHDRDAVRGEAERAAEWRSERFWKSMGFKP